MAITKLIDGLRVNIYVDDRPVRDIDTKNDEFTYRDKKVERHWKKVTTTKYIECVTGQKFEICFETSKRKFDVAPNGLEYAVEVDGKELGGGFLESKDALIPVWSCMFAGPLVHMSKGLGVLPMSFAELKTKTEGMSKKALGKQAEDLEDIGSIQVLIYEVAFRNKETSSKFNKEKSVSLTNSKTLAKNLKSHGTTLGEPNSVEEIATWDSERVDGDDYPLTVFHFKYRSREALKNLHIKLPATPEPEQEQEQESEYTTPEPEEERSSKFLGSGSTSPRITRHKSKAPIRPYKFSSSEEEDDSHQKKTPESSKHKHDGRFRPYAYSSSGKESAYEPEEELVQKKTQNSSKVKHATPYSKFESLSSDPEDHYGGKKKYWRQRIATDAEIAARALKKERKQWRVPEKVTKNPRLFAQFQRFEEAMSKAERDGIDFEASLAIPSGLASSPASILMDPERYTERKKRSGGVRGAGAAELPQEPENSTERATQRHTGPRRSTATRRGDKRASTEHSHQFPPRPVKRENDDVDSGEEEPQQKRKKMLGKVTVDLTETDYDNEDSMEIG